MTHRNGFTLVELVVVILILGILAGVAAPKLLNTSGDATDNGLRQTLSVIRNAIELHAAQNNGNMPPCAAGGADFKSALANYIRGDFPINPVASTDAGGITPTTGGTTTADGTTGWMFNTDNGTFICNDTSVSNDGTTTYDQF